MDDHIIAVSTIVIEGIIIVIIVSATKAGAITDMAAISIVAITKVRAATIATASSSA